MNIGILTALLTLLAWTIIPPAAAAGLASPPISSAADLINAVNSYRSQYGLEPYSIDGGLMAEAQDQSAYQASIGTCTHQRADGSGPAAHGISAENIACGMNLSASDAVYGQWTDQIHQATMVGPDSGQVGAGVVDSGGTVYYTLAVRRIKGEFISRAAVSQDNTPEAPGATQPADPLNIPGDLATSTPNGDGSIAHVLQYGETLVQIAQAYGITLPDLISMNRLDPNKPVYFAGQVLIIRPAFTLTPFITATFTPRPPTRTPLPTRTARPTRTPAPQTSPLPTRTITSTPMFRVPTLEDLGPGRPVMAYAFIALSAVGLLVLIFTAFWPGKRN